MDQLKGKVAVVTGGASGIGFALADRFAREGMKIVLADIEQGPLEAASKKLAETGSEVLAVRTDVAEAEQMDALGERTLERFGAVHVVCNNAGVAGGGPMWELTTGDWDFVMRPNLWGVIHGVRVFTRHMVAQNEGHIVNTASMAGLISVPGMGPYNVTKHAVVTLSETLHAELSAAGSEVGVSVLCPGFVKTRIYEPERHRPAGWQPREEPLQDEATRELREKMLAQVMASAMPPDAVAELVLEAVRQRRFYIFTHKGTAAAVERRMSALIDGKNPAPIQAAAFAGATE